MKKPSPPAQIRNLILILGDQLTPAISSLADADPARDQILMCEVRAEATYVPHHKKKIAFLFSAMRHFADELREAGWSIEYRTYDCEDNRGSFAGEVERAVHLTKPERIVVTEPGEWRVLEDMKTWQHRFGVPVDIRHDTRFVCSLPEFRTWAGGRTQLRMEYFYRDMRRKTGLLMDGNEPKGGKWNFDKENRKPAKADLLMPEPLGLPRNVVRYDSPTFGGFSVSASWGEDDMWDVAARYAGDWGDFKVAFTAAYAETTDLELIGAPFIFGPDKLKYLQAGAYIENVTTGLFAYAAYGKLETELPARASFTAPDAETLYAKGGLRQRWSSLGATVLYGEFLHNSDSAGIRQTFSSPTFTSTLDVSSSLDVWGLGLVQEIDAAAMSLWIKYRRMGFEFDGTFNGIPQTGLNEYQDFQYIGAGAIVHF